MLQLLTQNLLPIFTHIKSSQIDDWESLNITYENPRVERLSKKYTIELQEYRLYLHKIYECEKPFYHPHDWESAVYIVSGNYEMMLGTENEIFSTQIYGPGSAYDMTLPFLWHSVRPLNHSTHTIMLVGNKYERPDDPIRRPKKHENQKLDPLRKYQLLKVFKDMV